MLSKNVYPENFIKKFIKKRIVLKSIL